MTANLDTKALRALQKDACDLDGKSLMEVLHAQQKYERAVHAAAPALLDAAEERDNALQAIADLQAHVARAEDELHNRERERALTREALGFKCRTPEEDMGCGCLMIPTCDRAREVVAERDALRAENERLREALVSIIHPTEAAKDYIGYGIGYAHTIGELISACRKAYDAALAPRAPEVKP